MKVHNGIGYVIIFVYYVEDFSYALIGESSLSEVCDASKSVERK